MRTARYVSSRRVMFGSALLLLLGACGGSDRDAVLLSDDGTTVAASTAASLTAEVPVTDVPATEVATTGPTATDTTVESVTTAATPPDDGETETATTVQNDDIDETRLALAVAGLYTLPGTGAPCSLQEAPARFEYLFPAVGGDLYMLCLLGDYERHTSIEPFDLELIRPDGSSPIDATVTGFDDGRSLVLRPRNGGPAFVLGEYGTLNQSQAMVPIYLPHDRPSGNWIMVSNVGSASLLIDRPCAGQSGPSQSNPLDIPLSLQFARNEFVDFEHCRRFPDAANVDLAAANDIIENWADTLGITADIVIDQPCADDAAVIATAPGAGEVYRWFAGLAQHPVALTLEAGCDASETTATTTTTTVAPADADDDEESAGPDIDDVDDGRSETDPTR